MASWLTIQTETLARFTPAGMITGMEEAATRFNPFTDQPASLSQAWQLFGWGAASELGGELVNATVPSLVAVGSKGMRMSAQALSKLGVYGVRGGVEGVEGSQAAIRSRILANITESRAARNSSFFKIHSYVEQALFKLDVNTEIDTATFWSGKGNQELATNFAIKMDKVTLDMTPGGKYLDSLNLFKQYPYEQAVKPWDALSRRLAENASGNVYAFVEGARPTSVFNRIEYPILIENPEVAEIIFSPNYDNTLRPKY